MKQRNLERLLMLGLFVAPSLLALTGLKIVEVAANTRQIGEYSVRINSKGTKIHRDSVTWTADSNNRLKPVETVRIYGRFGNSLTERAPTTDDYALLSSLQKQYHEQAKNSQPNNQDLLYIIPFL